MQGTLFKFEPVNAKQFKVNTHKVKLNLVLDQKWVLELFNLSNDLNNYWIVQQKHFDHSGLTIHKFNVFNKKMITCCKEKFVLKNYRSIMKEVRNSLSYVDFEILVGDKLKAKPFLAKELGWDEHYFLYEKSHAILDKDWVVKTITIVRPENFKINYQVSHAQFVV